jgi:hypothetical protein
MVFHVSSLLQTIRDIFMYAMQNVHDYNGHCDDVFWLYVRVDILLAENTWMTASFH